MKPVNNKSLVAFLFDQMEGLKDGNVTREDALAQVAIALVPILLTTPEKIVNKGQ